MMSGPQAGKHLFVGIGLDGERKRGGIDKPFWIGFTTRGFVRIDE